MSISVATIVIITTDSHRPPQTTDHRLPASLNTINFFLFQVKALEEGNEKYSRLIEGDEDVTKKLKEAEAELAEQKIDSLHDEYKMLYEELKIEEELAEELEKEPEINEELIEMKKALEKKLEERQSGLKDMKEQTLKMKEEYQKYLSESAALRKKRYPHVT